MTVQYLHGSFFDVHVQSFQYGMAVFSHSVAFGCAADEDGLSRANVTRGRSVDFTTDSVLGRRNERLWSSGIFLHLWNSRNSFGESQQTVAEGKTNFGVALFFGEI